MLFKDICISQTDLTQKDISKLESLSEQLPLIADLTGTDIFIDCPTTASGVVVVSHARPSWKISAYKDNVVGQYALRENEPAVFEAIKTSSQVRDIKAITQENRIVKQDVVPILGESGCCIAVLIRETDVTSSVAQERKFQQLSKEYENLDSSIRSHEEAEYDIKLREAHHRIKNNLQIVASILNLQARGCADEKTRSIFKENVGRVLTIASIHDILTEKDMSQQIDYFSLMARLKYKLQSFVPNNKNILIVVDGDNMVLDSNTASSVALVINELVTNSLQHAFVANDSGEIRITSLSGNLFNTIVVSDNGCGFSNNAYDKERFGLKIVESTVSEKLHGHLRINTNSSGTRISFDF